MSLVVVGGGLSGEGLLDSGGPECGISGCGECGDETRLPSTCALSLAYLRAPPPLHNTHTHRHLMSKCEMRNKRGKKSVVRLDDKPTHRDTRTPFTLTLTIPSPIPPLVLM